MPGRPVVISVNHYAISSYGRNAGAYTGLRRRFDPERKGMANTAMGTQVWRPVGASAEIAMERLGRPRPRPL
jgi:hypothetical protein